jgi:hypothetical protein
LGAALPGAGVESGSGVRAFFGAYFDGSSFDGSSFDGPSFDGPL